MSDSGSTMLIRCETCGYDLRGTPAGALCPECARPVATSLATARTGLAWQQRRSLGSWMSTGLRAMWTPAKAADAVRLELASLRRLGLINLAITVIAFLIPGIISYAFGPRMLSLSPGGTRTFVIDDQASLLAVATLLTMPLYFGITLWVAGQHLIRGRNCRESYWATLALATFPLVLSSIYLLCSTLIIRSLPKEAVYQPPLGVIGMFVVAAIANRWLIVFASIAVAAIVHRTVFHRTRFANPLRMGDDARTS